MITLSALVTVAILGLSEASWPDGRYCLPMPTNQRCPTGWHKGYRSHDTEDDSGSNHCRYRKYGWVPYNEKLCKDLGWGFCCKTHANYPSTGKTWPKGSYCIFKYGGSCPSGFDEGHIRWDDEDSNNANKKRGVLPQGRYDENTRIEFCCRNDPVLSEVLACHTSIQAFQDPNVSCFKNFPKCSEFLLMRYKGTCPPNSPGYRGPHTGFLQWDTEDDNNGDGRVGVFPDGARNFWSGIKIEFCSYTSSSHNYC